MYFRETEREKTNKTNAHLRWVRRFCIDGLVDLHVTRRHFHYYFIPQILFVSVSDLLIGARVDHQRENESDFTS